MTLEERIFVEDIMLEYQSLVNLLKPQSMGGMVNYVDNSEIQRREAKIDGIRQSLSSILKCRISEQK